VAEEVQENTRQEPAEDVETLRQALAEERRKAEKYLANWQRTQADLENYAKRAERERAEIIESANRALMLNLLPVLDDFDRAFASLPPEFSNSSWTEGIKLVYNKFKSVLESEGLVEIKAEGELFDPYYHEAVGQGQGKEGVVIAEVRRGYKLKDKVLRPSMVIVGNGDIKGTQEGD
jgi:molecular chaperone GrpE